MPPKRPIRRILVLLAGNFIQPVRSGILICLPMVSKPVPFAIVMLVWVFFNATELIVHFESIFDWIYVHCIFQFLNLRVRCGRVDCPPLTCDERLAFRPEKRSCCKVCPNKTRTFSTDIAVSDQQSGPKSERDILAAGGCKHSYGGPYENGKEWHPLLYFHGIERCVTCRCKVKWNDFICATNCTVKFKKKLKFWKKSQ